MNTIKPTLVHQLVWTSRICPMLMLPRNQIFCQKHCVFFFLTSKVELKIYYVFISMYVYIHICLDIHVTNNIDRGILFM